MTFEEWEDTRVRAQDGFKEWLMRDNFGYVPAGWQEVWTYAPGIIVRLDGDTYFTHIASDQRPATADLPFRQTASRVRCIAWFCERRETRRISMVRYIIKSMRCLCSRCGKAVPRWMDRCHACRK
jgi:hypothetical protein